jgi:hypothetical protein
VKRLLFALLLLPLPPVFSPALDLWQYPEAADKNALFLDVRAAALSFTDGFSVWPPELAADYLLPFGLPVSLGVFMAIPDPNLRHFGARAAYHFDIHKKTVDLFFLYVFDLGWLRNDVLVEYGDEPVEIIYYDFRAGVRRLFGEYLALSLETGHKLRSVSFGVSVKIN